MERILKVESLDGVLVATVSERPGRQFIISSEDQHATDAINELIERGRKIGIVLHSDHRQKTDKGEVFRMYGRWSRPVAPDFLDALADALVEFNLFAYTEELVSA